MANTLTANEVHTMTLRSNVFLSNGSPDVGLLGTTSSSISCVGDALPGVSSISARCRTGQEGCLIATSRANVDLCFQNTTASRNIRLTGSVMSFGDVASPALSVSDTAVSILKTRQFRDTSGAAILLQVQLPYKARCMYQDKSPAVRYQRWECIRELKAPWVLPETF